MKKINLLKNAPVCNLESAFKLTHNANIAHDVMSHSRSGITYTVGNALKSITNAEPAVTKLMHVQLQSCTMNANDANTVKFLVVQLQHHVNLDRQTGQLLFMPVKMSAHAEENVV